MASTPIPAARHPAHALLVPTAAAPREAFLRMAQDWRDHDVDRYALALEDYEGYLRQLQADAAPSQPEGRVPSTQFCLQTGDEIVACIRLRSYLTAALALEGGHIGYDVRPHARGRGFASVALQQLLPLARRLGLERVLLTIDADNMASQKVVERNGGVYSGEVLTAIGARPMRHYWIDLSP
jgi:predicted acetyltransferase